MSDNAGFPGDEGYNESDWDHFAPVVEDSGIKIDWEKTPEFFGTFKGLEVKQAANKSTGAMEDAYLLLFTGKDGEDYSTFANYQLQRAFVDGDEKSGITPVQPGERVKIVWKGTEDIGGGQTMNRMSVYRATQPPAKAKSK